MSLATTQLEVIRGSLTVEEAVEAIEAIPEDAGGAHLAWGVQA